MRLYLAAVPTLLIVGTACGSKTIYEPEETSVTAETEDTDPRPGPRDADAPDAELRDGEVSDALMPDGGPSDGAIDDAAVVDGDVPDAALADGGGEDAGALDAGAFDAGELDAGAPDAGEADAGAADAAGAAAVAALPPDDEASSPSTAITAIGVPIATRSPAPMRSFATTPSS